MLKEILAWANTNIQNKKEAINLAAALVTALNNLPENKKLTEKELEKLAGGVFATGSGTSSGVEYKVNQGNSSEIKFW